MKETNEPSGPQLCFRSYTQNVQLFKQKPSFYATWWFGPVFAADIHWAVLWARL